MANQMIFLHFFPPPPPEEVAKAPEATAKDADAEPAKPDGGERPGEAAADEKPAANQADETKKDAAPDTNGAAAPAGQVEQPAIAPQWVTLGSGDPDSPYRMLVIATNQGAAIERIELNGPRFHELEDRTGYFGHLAPADAPQHGGALVRAVGLGTPAAVAGVQVGDVITAIDGHAIATAEALIECLCKRRPVRRFTSR